MTRALPILAALLGLLLASSAPADAAPRRVAVVVGSNVGAESEPVLRYAQRDARRVAQALRELGGVAAEDLTLLLDPTADRVREALTAARLRAEVEGAELLVYYSGHAGREALHLGSTRLAWSEIREPIEGSDARLRIALMDACHAGALVTPKGFGLGPRVDDSPAPPTGSAFLVASEAWEAAQEALTLGGSVFTHFLVSGLRGAADADGDGRVTLSEVRTFATRETRRATGARSAGVQHARYRMDITGHEDVVLTDLRRAVSAVQFSEDVSGKVILTDRATSLAAVEGRTVAGESLRLAVPAGRYVVHVRRPDAIYVAEVDLPWGGEARLGPDDLERRSYQTFARKGGRVRVRRHRLRLEGTVSSAPVSGAGATPWLWLGYGYDLGAVELGFRAGWSRFAFDAVDTAVRTDRYGGGPFVAWHQPLRSLDLRAWLGAEIQRWRQRIDRRPARNGLAGALALGAGLRIPLGFGGLFTEISAEARALMVDLDPAGLQVRPVATGGLALGRIF